VHHSLVRARNALTVQSKQHPDGWGLACFGASGPRLVRGTGAAFVDGAFNQAALDISSRSVIAHVRRASVGAIREENCHPFLRQGYAFAHNGDIARWAELQSEVEALIHPKYRQFEGETDSERCFALFLTHLEAGAETGAKPEAELNPRRAAAEATAEPLSPTLRLVARALRQTVESLRGLADQGAEKASVLTMVVGSESLLAAIHSGNSLWYSTHKLRCPERASCTFFEPSCEQESLEGDRIRHLLVASEPLSTENIWIPVPEGEVVGVDHNMRLLAPVRERQLPIHAGFGI